MFKPLSFLFIFLGLVLTTALRAAAAPALDARARALLMESMDYCDRLWDERAGMLWATPGDATTTHATHSTRATSWYALGLMLRDQSGDRGRSLKALEAVLNEQIDEPTQPWDGTFYVTPEEPRPIKAGEMWSNYDPNWREFIGTIFALFLIDYEDRLSAPLVARIENSISHAVQGEIKQGRLKPSYTNIALMHGFLWTYAGVRLKHPEWVRDGETWAKEVYQGFKEHDAFAEYNSPTYYGVDLYGLALWREHGVTDFLRSHGAEMEAALWRDIAQYYHAGLRNLAGPFDRSYGMDMRKYVALVGVWLRLAVDKNIAPLPDPSGPMDHENDFVCAPTYIILGTKIPEDALAHFRAFQGERQVVHSITGKRIATAWIGEKIILGGEFTDKTRSADSPHNQFFPATIHWRLPNKDVGWVLLKVAPKVDARAAKNEVEISATGDSTFRLSAPGIELKEIGRDQWVLPGLTVKVETDAKEFAVQPAEGAFDVHYRGATHFVLRTALSP